LNLGSLVRRWPGALLAVWGLLSLELFAIALARRSELASVWELELGALWLAPTLAVIAAASAVVGLGIEALLERAEAPGPRSALALLTTFAAGGLGWGVGGGRHLAHGATRSGFAVLVGLLAGAFVLSLAPWLARAHRRAPRGFAAAVAGCLLLLELCNHFVLPRLYPALHWGLAGLTLILAPLLVLRDANQASPRRFLPAAVLFGSVVIALFIAPSARRLAHFDNFRFLLLEQAPILGRAVELAAALGSRRMRSGHGRRRLRLRGYFGEDRGFGGARFSKP
jgi:hypothetical protein